ncbi:MAG: nucleotidyltransferase substrate binding protein [Ignavibacteria bacterium]|nr:nucleotidyltransferase substrate binding protein [Ignavibacteria bacterium]
MEQAEKYRDKLESFKKALADFDGSMKIDLAKFDDYTKDILMNGQVQKFEITNELLWKMVKSYLDEFHSIVVNSPKMTFKEFLNVRMIDEEMYDILFRMSESRNRLSHVYRHESFLKIYKYLPEYLDALKKVLDILENNK